MQLGGGGTSQEGVSAKARVCFSQNPELQDWLEVCGAMGPEQLPRMSPRPAKEGFLTEGAVMVKAPGGTPREPFGFCAHQLTWSSVASVPFSTFC